MQTISSPRDISFIELNSEEILVIACDSAGGMGEKAQDKIKVSNRILGKYTVKVPLMEVMAVGAEPAAVINNLAVEYEPSGREIIAGIKENLELINKVEFLNGSTEENISTVQTGLGVTVVAKAKISDLNKFTSSSRNNIAAAVGLPLVGKNIIKNKDKVVSLKEFLNLKRLDYLEAILPVGSKGILYELQILAAENNFDYQVFENTLDLKKSAGPASVVLVSLKEENYSKLAETIKLPLTKIGRLI